MWSKIYITRNAIIFLSFLLTLNLSQNIAQAKGDAVYSKAKKLQKLLDLSDLQKSKVVDILMSVREKNKITNEGETKSKIRFYKRINEINMEIEQILSFEQSTKFQSIKTTWFSKNKSKKDSTAEDNGKVKKEKKIKKRN